MSDVCKWENNAALPLGGRGVVHGPVKKHMWTVRKYICYNYH